MEKIRCKKCNSTQTYLRDKGKERYCRICGYVELIEGGQNESKKNK